MPSVSINCFIYKPTLFSIFGLKANNIRVLCYLTIQFYDASVSFFLIIELKFLISVAVANTFSPLAELVIPLGIPSKEAKVEMVIDPVIA